MPNESGGAVDDIIIYRENEKLFWIVVNAANTDKAGAILLSPFPDPLEPVTYQLSSDKEIEFLQVFPVTQDEMSFRKTFGADALIARLEDTKKASGIKKWVDFALSRMVPASLD